MDPLDLITDPTVHAYVLATLTALSVLLPVLEAIAAKTANTYDNRAVALLGKLLSYIPRLRPGNTQKAGETVARVSRKPPPVPPIAIVLLLSMLGGCAWFNETAKPVLRTIVEVARHLCLLTAEEQDAAARDGLTPAQFCEAEENLRPFIDEVLAAKQRASGKAGLTSGGEQ